MFAYQRSKPIVIRTVNGREVTVYGFFTTFSTHVLKSFIRYFHSDFKLESASGDDLFDSFVLQMKLFLQKPKNELLL